MSTSLRFHLNRLTLLILAGLWCGEVAQVATWAAEPEQPAWKYAPKLLRPFWEGDTVEGESVLFIKDAATGEAHASLLFPPLRVSAVRNSSGEVSYEEGRDYTWKPDSRQITLPAGSRIISRTPEDLRRPAKSQKYELTHRDGNGEIFFGAGLEYHDMQTCITYTHGPEPVEDGPPGVRWKVFAAPFLRRLHAIDNR